MNYFKQVFATITIVAQILLVGAFGTLVFASAAAAAGPNPPAPVVDLFSQCSNDIGDGYGAGDTGCRWTNGNLQPNNSLYREGEATVQRLALKDLTTGDHTVTIEYQTTKGGKHAYDFETDDTYSENWITDADMCDPSMSNFADCATTAPVLSPVIPSDLLASGYDTQASPRHFKIRNGVITNVGTPTLVSGSYAGDSLTDIQLTFHVDADTCANAYMVQGFPVCEVLITWGGHISSQADWGTGNSAINIEGSPYHQKVVEFDGKSVSSRDNQMQANTIVQGSTVTVHKVTTNGDTATNFTFNAIGAGYNGFNLVGGGQNSQSLTPSSYSVTEAPLSGWENTGVACTASGTGSSATVNGSTVDITIGTAGGAVIDCTYTNTLKEAHLTLIKTVTTDNGGIAAPTDWTLSASGPTSIFGASGDASVTNAAVNAGTYTLSETDGPAGYAAGGWSCTEGTLTGDSLVLAAGDNATCTINNDDQAAHLIVIKHVINDNGGTAVAADFATTIFGVTTATPSAAGVESPGVDNVLTTVGSYDIDEGAHVGYEKTLSADCSSTIALGETKTCTITNDDIAPKLTVIKHVVNDEDGTLDAEDFTMNAAGTNVSASSFAGSESGTEITLDAGAYSVSETDSFGYSQNASEDCSGIIAVGEEKTCTITNNDFDVLPEVSLEKTVDDAEKQEPGGTFNYTLAITNNSVEDVVITALSDTNALSLECLALIGTTLTPGQTVSCTYSVIHTDTGTYPNTASVTVEDNENNSVSDEDSKTVKVVGANISIDPLTATNYINSPHTFTVTVMKNDGSGWVPAAGEHADFFLTDNGGAIAVLDSALSTCDDVGANTDALGQCTIVLNSATAGTITIHATVDVVIGSETLTRATDGTLGSSGDAVKTYVAGALEISKVVEGLGSVVNSASLTKDFTVTVTGPSYPSGYDITFTLLNGVLQAPTSVILDPIIPGDYTITEADAGMEWTETVPSGDVVVVASQTTAATVTNTYVAGSLEVIKSLVLGNYSLPVNTNFSVVVTGPSYPSGTTLSFAVLNGVVSGPQTLDNLIPGGYTVVENDPGIAWGATGGGNAEVDPGTTVSSTVINTLKQPHTTISITPDTQETLPGENVILTISDTNDGDVPLSNNMVVLTYDTTTIILDKNSPNFSGDTNNDGIMDKGETWTWTYSVLINSNTTFVVAGHGTDLFGNDISSDTGYLTETDSIIVRVVGTTRTIGFWQTHTDFTSAIFQDLLGTLVIGSGSHKGEITGVDEIFGGFYALIARTSSGGKRNPMDQARITLLQQLLAAKLNCAAFGCAETVQGQIAAADAAYAAGVKNDIMNYVSILDVFNNSGDENAIPAELGATGKATPSASKTLADAAFWDNP